MTAESDLSTHVKALFGDLFHVTQPYTSTHDGVDIGAMSGTPLRSIAAGTVSYAMVEEEDPEDPRKHWALGGGRTVNVDIGGNRTLQYAHLKSFVVKKGDKVAKGTLLGRVGASGNAHGSHVHFGLWDHDLDEMVKPYTYLATLAGKAKAGPKFAGFKVVPVETFAPDRHFVVPSGGVIRGYDPGRPNQVVRQRTFEKGSGASASALVKITWPGLQPSPVPHGIFLKVSTGVFKDLFIPAKSVTLK